MLNTVIGRFTCPVFTHQGDPLQQFKREHGPRWNQPSRVNIIMGGTVFSASLRDHPAVFGQLATTRRTSS